MERHDDALFGSSVDDSGTKARSVGTNRQVFVAAALRMSRNLRQLDHKMNLIVDYQIANKEGFSDLAKTQALTDERFSDLAKTQARTDERFSDLAKTQVRTDERLDSLIDILRKEDNGGSGQKS